MFWLGVAALLVAACSGEPGQAGISQGEPVRVADVLLDGFEVLPAEALARLRDDIRISPGHSLTDEAVSRARRLAVETLQEHGYPYAEVVITRELQQPGHVRVRVEARPGPIAYFGPIHIAGNVRLDDRVIRRQLVYRPGEPFRRSALIESQRLVASLEIIDNVTIEIANAERRLSEVETIVTVVEGKPNRVSFSLGYGTEEKLSGETNWRHVNFAGGGRTLGARAKWSWLDRGVEGRFTAPYLFRPNLSLGLQARDWHLYTPVFRTLSRGGQASVTYTRGSRFSSTVTLVGEFERSQLSHATFSDRALTDNLEALGLNPADGVQDGALIGVSLDAERRTAADMLDPLEGYVASVHVEQGGGWLPGTFDYYSMLAELRWYHPVFDRVILAERIRYGSIAPIGREAAVPFSKRHFLGGADSLRGWGRLEVSPLSRSGHPIGGHSLFEASSEARVRLTSDIGGVVFLDLGSVWANPWDFQPGNLFYDAGLGVRYRSPFGLLRFDLAYQLNRLDGLLIDGRAQNRPWRVHFSIGQAF